MRVNEAWHKKVHETTQKCSSILRCRNKKLPSEYSFHFWWTIPFTASVQIYFSSMSRVKTSEFVSWRPVVSNFCSLWSSKCKCVCVSSWHFQPYKLLYFLTYQGLKYTRGMSGWKVKTRFRIKVKFRAHTPKLSHITSFPVTVNVTFYTHFLQRLADSAEVSQFKLLFLLIVTVISDSLSLYLQKATKCLHVF